MRTDPPCVIAYVTEEVRRQGHDVEAIDGIERVSWMLDAWVYASIQPSREIDLRLIVELGRRIERLRNVGGLRKTGVRVGPRVCPSHTKVKDMLASLLPKQHELAPMDFYKEFELIHPFVDGNGRTGKILLNWLNGTLDAPIFPPTDLFGYPIQNP